MLCGGWCFLNKNAQNVKNTQKMCFLPCSEPKKTKKWRISAGLRRKNDWWGGIFLLFLMGWADFCKEINKKPEDIADHL